MFKCSLFDNQPRSDCPLVYLNSLIEANPQILNVQLIEFSVHFSQTINVHFFVKRIIFPGNLNLFKFLIGYSFPSSQILTSSNCFFAYLMFCVVYPLIYSLLWMSQFSGWFLISTTLAKACTIFLKFIVYFRHLYIEVWKFKNSDLSFMKHDWFLTGISHHIWTRFAFTF